MKKITLLLPYVYFTASYICASWCKLLPCSSNSVYRSNVNPCEPAYLCRVSELYSSYASPARVDVKLLDDVDDCSKDVHLKVFLQQVERRVDYEHNVGLLTTLDLARLCHRFGDTGRLLSAENQTQCCIDISRSVAIPPPNINLKP